MLPSLATDDVANMVLGDSKPFAYLPLRNSLCSKSADFAYLRFGKFRAMVVNPASTCPSLSPLPNLVGIVIGISPQEKMMGIHAGRIVAVMANEQTFRNWAIVKFPGDTMRNKMRAVLASFIDNSIVADAAGPLPFPTIIERASRDMSPETLRDGDGCSFKQPSTSDMSNNVAVWFPFNGSELRGCFLGYVGFLSATAAAVTWFNFLRGVVRGMIVHSNSLLCRLLLKPGTINGRRLALVLVSSV